MLHRHHIIPRHMGGTDDPSNIKKVTVAEHAEEHRKLYEQHGKWQDKLAWETLSGQISTDQARRIATAKSNSERVMTKETLQHLRRISKKAAKLRRGTKDTPERIAKRTTSLLANKTKKGFSGKKHSPETLAKMSAAASARWAKVA